MRCRFNYDRTFSAHLDSSVRLSFKEEKPVMSLEYLMTTGALVIAFLSTVLFLMEALVGSMAIKTFLFSLPVG